MGKIDVERLEKIFEKANKNFLRNNRLLIEVKNKVSTNEYR